MTVATEIMTNNGLIINDQYYEWQILTTNNDQIMTNNADQ